MDNYTETPNVIKPVAVVEKLPIDKRQIDYLRKLKVKLENGVNVKILPKTKSLMKDLFGLDADEIKIKKNPSPLDEEETSVVEKPVEKPVVEKPADPLTSVKPNVDDVINKIVELVLELRPPEKQKEFVVIHKHYYYKPEKEEEEDNDEEEEDDDVDIDEEIEDGIKEANALFNQKPLVKPSDPRDELRRKVSQILFV